jgi:transcription-repair coupling factor (superfamily II helicase)
MNFEEGFELPEFHVACLTSRELFGYRSKLSRFMNRYKEAAILKSYDELRPGDYVVHETSGIGQFLGIKRSRSTGSTAIICTCLCRERRVVRPLVSVQPRAAFRRQGRLRPRLNRLNSTEWEKTKKRIKERVSDLADRLVALYKERAPRLGLPLAKTINFKPISKAASRLN